MAHHGAKHGKQQLGNGIGIGTRGIKNADTLLCSLFHRNIINAGPCSCYCQKLMILIRINRTAADNNAMRVSLIRGN